MAVLGQTKMDEECTTVLCWRLTKAKGSWSGDGGRLDWRGGVETSHQQTVKWNTGRDGHCRRERRIMFTGKHFTFTKS